MEKVLVVWTHQVIIQSPNNLISLSINYVIMMISKLVVISILAEDEKNGTN